ncbi:FAD-binding oxidoreductase [Candidatus Riflebacteria bacterium]
MGNSRIVIEAWKERFFPENLCTDEGVIQDFSKDATSYTGNGQAVFFARNTGEIQKLVNLAREEKIPLVARGAGTGQSGGAVPARGGIIVSFQKMNKILSIDRCERVACVEAGVITSSLQQAVSDVGLFYPPDPASLDKCSIGGNIAENAGGARCFKYGTTKDYVLGLEIITAAGDIITTSPALLKNVMGFDLTKLICGSEGTLALVCKAWLKLLVKPDFHYTFLLEYGREEAALHQVSDFLHAGLSPSTMEWLDKTAISLIKEDNSGLFQSAATESVLIIEFDGMCREEVETHAKRLLKHSVAEHYQLIKEQEKAEVIWEVRRALSPKLKTLNRIKWNEDIVVPRHLIPECVKMTRTFAYKHDFLPVMFGHAGDGNIHVNFLLQKKSAKQLNRVKILQEFFAKVIAMGGSLTGEHGIGLSKAEHLEIALGRAQMELIRRIKSSFDPDNILNPGKMNL